MEELELGEVLEEPWEWCGSPSSLQNEIQVTFDVSKVLEERELERWEWCGSPCSLPSPLHLSWDYLEKNNLRPPKKYCSCCRYM